MNQSMKKNKKKTPLLFNPAVCNRIEDTENSDTADVNKKHTIFGILSHQDLQTPLSLLRHTAGVSSFPLFPTETSGIFSSALQTSIIDTDPNRQPPISLFCLSSPSPSAFSQLFISRSLRPSNKSLFPAAPQRDEGLCLCCIVASLWLNNTGPRKEKEGKMNSKIEVGGRTNGQFPMGSSQVEVYAL